VFLWKGYTRDTQDAEDVIGMQFDWDSVNRKHIGRHDISPYEAEQVLLNDPLDLEMQVVDGEERFTQVGETKTGRILVIAAIWQNDLVRVITGWDAPTVHKQEYLQDRMKIWPPPS
jgi:uncharacterized DUF497 family protein